MTKLVLRPRATRWRCGVAAAWLLGALHGLGAQQVPDSAFVPDVGAPAWKVGSGPRLMLDEAHHNFHTLSGRYYAFGRMASAIGFRVASHRTPFSDASLRGVDVLVISNALHSRNVPSAEPGAPNGWSLPTPSAFTADEIAAVRRWVERGGGLVLVADHMPFAGAAAELGNAFGVDFLNGYAFDGYATDARSDLVYRRGERMAFPPGVGAGIDSIVLFTGAAFRLTGAGVPLLTLPGGSRVWLPRVAWVFGDSVPSVKGDGLLQGAALTVGRGRVLVLAEAAMLSAQRAGPNRQPMGMNQPRAVGNARWGAAMLRWVAGDR